MSRISKEQFIEAFREEWAHQAIRNRQQIDIDWAAGRCNGSSKTPWTTFMLRKGGFLDSVRGRLAERVSPLDYYPEMYTIDAAFVGGSNLHGSDFSYPSALHVLIEHELESFVESEMWKLIFWRTPLKVLIFYDYDDHKKLTASTRGWLGKKLTILREMIKRVEAESGMGDDSEYLFLIGCKESAGGPIHWRWASHHEEDGIVSLHVRSEI